MRVGPQVQRVAQLAGCDRTEAKASANRTFARYDLPAGVRDRYPFQLSGGMARRVLVSTAVVTNAQLVIADEPTQGCIPMLFRTLSHLRELALEGRGVILITHDIEAALQIADRVAVFYAGTTVEVELREIFLMKTCAILIHRRCGDRFLKMTLYPYQAISRVLSSCHQVVYFAIAVLGLMKFALPNDPN